MKSFFPYGKQTVTALKQIFRSHIKYSLHSNQVKLIYLCQLIIDICIETVRLTIKKILHRTNVIYYCSLRYLVIFKKIYLKAFRNKFNIVILTIFTVTSCTNNVCCYAILRNNFVINIVYTSNFFILSQKSIVLYIYV